MAEISARIKPKKSSTSTEVPSASDLEVAEIAVNTADGKLFVKHTDNSVKTIGGNVSGIDDLTDVDTSTVAPTDGQALLWDNANSQWEPGDVAGNTDLTYTASTRLLGSSTGTDVTLPEVVAAGDSGLMTGADKTKLDGIDAGAQVNVATDLSNTPAASTVDVESSTGTNTTLPAATTTLAGVMTGADKTKLDGIAAGAEVNVATDLTYTASTRVLASSTGTDATLPEVVASGDSGLITGADKAKLDGISAGAEVNAVDSVAGKTGAVTLVKADITDFSDADYATAAQGTLADSATQPGDNVSTLVNDAGYLTDVEIVVSSTAPSSPNQGLLWYDLEDARTFVYTGTEWADASPDAGNPVVITSDSAPSNPQDGDLWYRSTDGRMYVYYDDGTTSQWVDANPSISSSDWTRTGTTISPTQAGDDLEIDGDVQMASLNGDQLAGFRNQFINGDISVSQRYEETTSTFNGSKIFPVDRWAITGGPNGATFSAGGSGFVNPTGMSTWLNINATSAVTFLQAIELPVRVSAGRSPYVDGSAFTISFYSEGGLSPTVNVRWMDDSAGSNASDAGTNGYQAMTETAVDATWSRYTYSFNIGGSPVSSNRALVVSFQLTPIGGSSQVSGFQFEPGPVATPFEHRPYATELALCQRYFQLVGAGIGYKKYSSRMRPLCGMIFPVEMRTTPTAALISPAPSSFNPLVRLDGTSGGGTNNVALSEISSIASINASSSGLVRLNLIMNDLALFDNTTTYGAFENFAQLDAEL